MQIDRITISGLSGVSDIGQDPIKDAIKTAHPKAVQIALDVAGFRITAKRPFPASLNWTVTQSVI